MHSRTHSPAVFRNMPLLSPPRPPLLLSPRSRIPLSPAVRDRLGTARVTQCLGHRPSRVQSMMRIFREYLLSGCCRHRTNDATPRSPRTRIGRSANIASLICVPIGPRPCRELRTDLDSRIPLISPLPEFSPRVPENVAGNPDGSVQTCEIAARFYSFVDEIEPAIARTTLSGTHEPPGALGTRIARRAVHKSPRDTRARSSLGVFPLPRRIRKFLLADRDSSRDSVASRRSLLVA